MSRFTSVREKASSTAQDRSNAVLIDAAAPAKFPFINRSTAIARCPHGSSAGAETPTTAASHLTSYSNVPTSAGVTELVLRQVFELDM